MAKLGMAQRAVRDRAAGAALDSVAQPGRIETPPAETERRAGGAPATEAAATRDIAFGAGEYRRVFACAKGASDSPDEERLL